MTYERGAGRHTVESDSLETKKRRVSFLSYIRVKLDDKYLGKQ